MKKKKDLPGSVEFAVKDPMRFTLTATRGMRHLDVKSLLFSRKELQALRDRAHLLLLGQDIFNSDRYGQDNLTKRRCLENLVIATDTLDAMQARDEFWMHEWKCPTMTEEKKAKVSKRKGKK